MKLVLHQRLDISLRLHLKSLIQDEMQQPHLMKASSCDTSPDMQTLSPCSQGNEQGDDFEFSPGIWVRTLTALPIKRQSVKEGQQWGSTVCRWHCAIQASENKGLPKDMMRLSKWAIKQLIKFNVAKCEVMFMAGKMFWTSHIRLWALGSLRSKIFGL